MENLNKVFEKYVSEEVITEEAKKEIEVVFEAMVNQVAEEKFEIARTALLEEYDEKFDTVVAEHKEVVTNQLNDYMEHVVNEFIESNKLAIKDACIVEKAKSIIDGVQKVFEDHGIRLPEGNTDIVSEMNERNVEITSKYNETVNKNIELVKEANELKKAVIFMKATNDLSEVSKEKLINLMSGLVTESVEDFAEKLEIVKSTLVSEAKKVKENDDEDVDDEVDNDEEDSNEKKDRGVEESRKVVKEHLSKLSNLRRK
jgi:hypothetical protein